MTNGAKKSDGYVKTMVPPDGMTDTGENDNFTSTFVLPAMRSEGDMVNYEYIGPDGTGKDAAGFALVDSETPDVLPLVAGPVIRPLSVTVTDTLASIVTVPVVNTMADAFGMAAMPTTAVVTTTALPVMVDVAVMGLLRTAVSLSPCM